MEANMERVVKLRADAEVRGFINILDFRFV